MSLGYDRELNIVNKGDTALISVFLFDKDDAPIPAEDLVAVSVTVQAPDKTQITANGIIEDNGSGSLAYTTTTQVGHYTAVAKFTLLDASIKSTRTDFEVIDPFAPTAPVQDEVIEAVVWKKLEDCYDGTDEGPYLRDMTLNYFGKQKISNFIDEALFDINQINPPTDLAVGAFVLPDGTPTTDLPLLAQAIFISVVHHLMRSYTEQPNVMGAQIAWHDRRDYLERWGVILQTEQVRYDRWVKLWKRQFLGLGSSRTLVSSKAGRLIPAPMRTRNVGRGYF